MRISGHNPSGGHFTIKIDDASSQVHPRVGLGILGVGISVGGVVGAATVAGCEHAEISNNTSIRRIRRLLIIFVPP